MILLSRPCTPDEYEAVARMVAYDIGIDMFDDTTYQPHRLMYWPSTSIDGEYVFEHEENKPLDVDKVLANMKIGTTYRVGTFRQDNKGVGQTGKKTRGPNA